MLACLLPASRLDGAKRRGEEGRNAGKAEENHDEQAKVLEIVTFRRKSGGGGNGVGEGKTGTRNVTRGGLEVLRV